MRNIISILPLLVLIGCNSRETAAHSFQAANSSALGVPANFSMTVGVAPTINATTLTKKQFERLKLAGNYNGCSFTDNLYYIGSKNGFHYYMFCPAMGFREMFRISIQQHKVEDEFELTTSTRLWKNEKGDHIGNLNLHWHPQGIVGDDKYLNLLDPQRGLMGGNAFRLGINLPRLDVAGNGHAAFGAINIGGNALEIR